MAAIGRVVWNGLTMGPGTAYAISDLPDLDDMPDVRAYDVDRTGAHGTWTGPDYVGARVITMGITLRGADADDLGRLTIALKQAFQPAPAPQQLQFLDRGLMVWAKVRRRRVPYEAGALLRTTAAQVQFYCADPRVYSLAQYTGGPVPAYAPASGRSYPRAYPWLYGTGGSGGSVTCVNNGGSETYPVLRIDGPCVRPSVQLSETGAVLQLNNILNPGEFVLINTANRAVLAGGQTPRRDWVIAGSDWPIMPPGASTFVYRSDPYGDGTVPTYLTVTWRDATL
ncbi:unknown [Streptomyces phage mu1/6]|uniref:minor tail protein n=1 Tax=Streptomyces phage mu1/6 TaxID=370623 RepID=UPI0000D4F6DC|nr:minor tail protein [Streptomyces phage mu1/6]ABD94211.1 unknown [Streptomyces phage mu1/6]